MDTVLVAYWLREHPANLGQSDHWYWFSHFLDYKTQIYFGPHIDDGFFIIDGKCIICLKTASLLIDLRVIASRLWENYRRCISTVHLYWHVMEMSATCRVQNLDILQCSRIAVIGDTHHMNNPITGLYSYLGSACFTHVCCSHNQFNPFFAALYDLIPIDFPFNKHMTSGSTMSRSFGINKYDNKLTYYGNLLSRHHLHRTRLLSSLLLSKDISGYLHLYKPQKFRIWDNCLQNPQYNLSCSLNGTFSFQTWLPMLYGCRLFTDPITRTNWVGETLVDRENCIIYNSIEDIVESFFMLLEQSKVSNEIACNASWSIDQRVRSIAETKDIWRNEKISESRLYTTISEQRMNRRFKDHILKYGENHFYRCVHLFEKIQERHRLCWWGEITIMESTTYQSFESDYVYETISSMLELLPRFSLKPLVRCKVETFRSARVNQLVLGTLALSQSEFLVILECTKQLKQLP